MTKKYILIDFDGCLYNSPMWMNILTKTKLSTILNKTLYFLYKNKNSPFTYILYYFVDMLDKFLSKITYLTHESEILYNIKNLEEILKERNIKLFIISRSYTAKNIENHIENSIKIIPGPLSKIIIENYKNKQIFDLCISDDVEDSYIFKRVCKKVYIVKDYFEMLKTIYYFLNIISYANIGNKLVRGYTKKEEIAI